MRKKLNFLDKDPTNFINNKTHTVRLVTSINNILASETNLREFLGNFEKYPAILDEANFSKTSKPQTVHYMRNTKLLINNLINFCNCKNNNLK